MTYRYNHKVVERTLAGFMGNNLRWGGNKIIVMGGDFQQVIPVVRRGTRGQVFDACLKRSPLWEMVIVRRFLINMRVMAEVDSQRLRDFSGR